jgi:predicted ABC-type ATPase
MKEHLAPVLTIIAGPMGSGKSTVLLQLPEEIEMPNRLVIDNNKAPQEVIEAIEQAIASQHSLTVETALFQPEILALMEQATDEGFDVELIIIGIDHIDIAKDRLKQRDIDDLVLATMHEKTWHYLPAAMDRAKRVLIIDNNTGAPSIAMQIAAGVTIQQSAEHPSFLNRLLQSKIERNVSRQFIQKTFNALTSPTQLTPVLQTAKVIVPANFTGPILEKTDHHVLQQVSQALHLIHDIALMPYGGITLIKGAVATITYPAQKPLEIAPEITKTLDKSLSR